MTVTKFITLLALLFMLNGCAGAQITIPLGPVTIGTSIPMFGDSSRDRRYDRHHDRHHDEAGDAAAADEEFSDNAESDEHDHQDERE